MSLYQNEAAAVSAEQRHSEAEEAMLEALYADLKPEANLMYVNYFLARTPAHLQEDMKALVEAGLADDPPVMMNSDGSLVEPAPEPEPEPEVEVEPEPEPVVEPTPYQQARDDAGPYYAANAGLDPAPEEDPKP